MNYIFDVDGTLTPSRLPIDKKFKKFFIEWMKDKNVYLVTGSDKDKTIEQVGEEIWNNCTRAYQSCGNAVYENGKLIKQSNFKLDDELRRMLFTFKACSDWKEQYGNHIEERIGLINYSTVGRDCPQSAREKYYEFDNKNEERKMFCQIVETTFPHLEASIGGQISIDIYPKGKNKSQILDDVKGDITFFGDRCEFGGNDYPIVEKIKDFETIHSVKNWEETYKILKKI
jgi:phosphomannomutase